MIIKFKRLWHWLVAVGAYWFYGRPAKKLIVIGVTGTKGKSTTCRFIASVLEASGFKVATLSTVEIKIGDKQISNKPQMTMLGRGQIQKYLRLAVNSECQYAVIETSSEGILQYRHLGLQYDIAVFTNLGTEHHERHGGFANLKRDKGKLFSALGSLGRKKINGQIINKIVIVNAGDPNSEYYYNFKADEKYKFSLADFDGDNYKINLVGEFNKINAAAAIVLGKSQGISAENIACGIASVTAVPGRMQFIDVGQNFYFVVDYAHEAISLNALFAALRPLVKPPGQLVGIIGSDGGGRDITKRGQMGEIAGRLCDIVIIADVNPWDEDPKEIAEMLAAGARRANKIDGENLFIVIDRRAAIQKACALAGAGGVAVITAKGTESAIIGKNGVRRPWNDAAAVAAVLRAFVGK